MRRREGDKEACMQQTRWTVGATAMLVVAGFTGCGDRVEQSAVPPGGPTGAARQEAAPAPGLKVVTLNVKGMS
jgi:hypothetical protein